MSTKLTEEIAERLKTARKAAGYKSAKDFADNQGLPVSTYFQHETGRRGVDAELILDYSARLQVNPHWLLTGAGDPNLGAVELGEKAMALQEMPSVSQELAETSKHRLMDIDLLKKVLFAAGKLFDDPEVKLSYRELMDYCFDVYEIVSTLTADPAEKETIINLTISSVKLGARKEIKKLKSATSQPESSKSHGKKMVLHSDVLNISFTHRHKIRTVFNEILGIDGIEHFSLDLVNPVGEMLFFSGTPQHAFEICKRGLGNDDGIISPEYYENFEFYWWDDAMHKAHAERIKEIRENYLGLRHGFMLVRKWNNFHLLYSFATKHSDPDFQSQVINKINSFLRAGDYAYSRMRETYAIYSGGYEPPSIEKFFPFEGGKPPARYTKDFNHSSTPLISDLSSANKGYLVPLNFQKKKRTITIKRNE